MKAIGIDLQIKATDADTVSADSIAGNYDMYFTGWSTNPDPDYQLGINTCGNRALTTDGNGGTSQDGYCDPEFDRLFAAQRSAMDEKQRIDIVRQMQEMNYTATPQIALWYPDMLEAYRSDRFDDFGLQPSDGGIIANQAGYWGFLSARPRVGLRRWWQLKLQHRGHPCRGRLRRGHRWRRRLPGHAPRDLDTTE